MALSRRCHRSLQPGNSRVECRRNHAHRPRHQRSSQSHVKPTSRQSPLFHSDRGCQYTSKEFRKLIALYGLPQSMSAQGYCYDNAANESFFASLKRESFPEGCCFDSKAEAEARRTILDYLEVFYNDKRRHSSLGNVSPETFLNQHFQTQKTHLN